MSGRAFQLGQFVLVLFAAVLWAGGPSGCRPSLKVDTGRIDQAFQSADADVRRDVMQAVAALKKGDFETAVTPLKNIVQSGKLDAQQKDAISGLVTNLQMVITRNPGKYSVDLYNSVSDLTAYLEGREPVAK